MFRILLTLLATSLGGLNGVAGQAIDMGSFVEGNKVYIFNDAVTDSSVIDYTFSWNSDRVEPVAIISPSKIVTTLTQQIPTSVSDILYADVSPSNVIRIVFRLKSGSDFINYNLTTMPVMNTNNFNCSVVNSKSQVDPFMIVCYNVSFIEHRFNRTFEEPGEIRDCFHENNLTVSNCSLLNSTNSRNFSVAGNLVAAGWRRRLLGSNNSMSLFVDGQSNNVLNSNNVSKSDFVVNS